MKFYYSAILFSLVFAISFAQENDTLNISKVDAAAISPVDSLLIKTSGSSIDTVIYSSASDSLIFYVKDKKMSIYGD